MDIRQITKLYDSGVTIKNIAISFNIPLSTIYYRLRRINFKFRPIHERNCKNSKETTSQILELYCSGISLSKLATQFNMSITGISNIMQRHNIQIRPFNINTADWSFIKSQKSFFFYWLGWMLADGCVFPRHQEGRNRGITSFLTVHKNDLHILEFFKNIIKKGQKIKIKKDHCCRLDISMPRNIFNEIVQWGLIPNKTYLFKVTPKLDNISEKQFYQLLVGVIEGDGNVSHVLMKSKKHSYPVLTAGICSSNKLVIWISEKLFRLGYKKRKIYYRKNRKICADYRISGKDAIRLCNRLMKCKYHLLNRKWDRTTKPSAPSNTNET
jgi:hypothetical protein